jgi:hypothetical protein
VVLLAAAIFMQVVILEAELVGKVKTLIKLDS